MLLSLLRTYLLVEPIIYLMRCLLFLGEPAYSYMIIVPTFWSVLLHLIEFCIGWKLNNLLRGNP